MISIEEYKANPCRVSSIPSWKMNAIKTPRTIVVVNHEEFMANPGFFLEDTLYFRLKHDLGNVEPANLPEGFAYQYVNLNCSSDLEADQARTALSQVRLFGK